VDYSVESFFYPPDAARGGTDLSALVVVRLVKAESISRAGEKLLRSGGFGVVVLDLGAADIPMPLQTRLTGLAHRHHAALVASPKRALRRFPWARWFRYAPTPKKNGRRTTASLALCACLKTSGAARLGIMKNSIPGRLACVDLPAFPLQLLLRRNPDWAGHPAAVVAEDKPQGLVLWVNEKARQQGVLPGLRYAAAFSLASTLRAGEVAPAESNKAVAELTCRLMRFTPEVEPSVQEPGVFWLNGAGLQRLYASVQKWAFTIHKDLRSQGFTVESRRRLHALRQLRRRQSKRGDRGLSRPR
jgi:hypothetical protein